MGKMTFTQAGLFTSIQDDGRYGFRKYGVPVSGAMDRKHALLANLLVNNSPHHPVLEITLSGPEIHFDESAVIAITGADLSPVVGHQPAPMNTSFTIPAGQTLSFGKPKYGVRAYLAVKGGPQVPKILNSYSWYGPVTGIDKIDPHMKLDYESHDQPPQHTRLKPAVTHFQSELLNATPGPEYNILDDQLKKLLPDEQFTIGENNRMGYHLHSEKMDTNQHSIITAPVCPGTVQLTPAGRLMVLMRDSQVSGGYPRILQLTETSINRLAQKSTGQTVRFLLD